MDAKSLRELLDEKMTSPPFVIYPILPKGGKLFIYGPKKHFKSMLAFNFIYDIAEGWPVMGIWEIPRPYSVLVIEQEIGAYMVKKRFEALHSYRGGSIALDNIMIVSKERRFKLDSKEGFAFLRTTLEKLKPDILVLDPIRKFHRQDENDSTAITTVVDQMDSLVEEYGISFIVLHHQGHENMMGTKHMRGSSVWGDEADSILALSKPIRSGPKKNLVIRMEIEDIRHASTPDKPMDFLFDPATCTFKREVEEKK